MPANPYDQAVLDALQSIAETLKVLREEMPCIRRALNAIESTLSTSRPDDD